MKERGILFSAPMVRAILAGTKTQTRRPVKWPLYSKSDGAKRRIFLKTDVEEINALLKVVSRHPCKKGFCPYGAPGDRLWVRETWSARDGNAVLYKADNVARVFPRKWYEAAELRSAYNRHMSDVRPSIHMPRWASRITLEITAVRVERLQDISIADAMAEGVVEFNARLRGLEPCMEWRYAYEDLWRGINGPGSWDKNPWVWVIEFRRV